MEKVIKTKFDNLSNLAITLLHIERECADSMDGASINTTALQQARSSVATLAAAYKQNRYNFGRALRHYQQHFKKQRGWIAAADVIAKAIGREVRTIYRLIEGYESAEALSPLVLVEMQEQGIDPGAAKNSDIVRELQTIPQPTVREDVKAVVAQAKRKHAEQKREKRNSATRINCTLEQFSEQIEKKFHTRYRDASKEQRLSEVRYIFGHVLDSLGIDLNEWEQIVREGASAESKLRKAA